MKLLDLLITAIALSMDALAVSDRQRPLCQATQGFALPDHRRVFRRVSGPYAAARLPSGQLVRLVHPEI